MKKELQKPTLEFGKYKPSSQRKYGAKSQRERGSMLK